MQKAAADDKDLDAAVVELMLEVCLIATSSQHSEALIDYFANKIVKTGNKTSAIHTLTATSVARSARGPRPSRGGGCGKSIGPRDRRTRNNHIRL